ncbi:hypothetical protein [Boudabousia marimammalium]|nr:hypothetical protein [Boudabousia marimammalium]
MGKKQAFLVIGIFLIIFGPSTALLFSNYFPGILVSVSGVPFLVIGLTKDSEDEDEDDSSDLH